MRDELVCILILTRLAGPATPLWAPTESAVPYITGPRDTTFHSQLLILHPRDHLHITYLGPMQAAGAGIALWNVVAKVALQREREVCVCDIWVYV